MKMLGGKLAKGRVTNTTSNPARKIKANSPIMLVAITVPGIPALRQKKAFPANCIAKPGIYFGGIDSK
jgi:hypothetical protein